MSLGTNHSIQQNIILGDEFNALVRHLIQKYSILAVSEEIRPTDYSIAKQIANELDISHLIIEPTLEEKKELGIDDPGRIEMELMMGSVEPGEQNTFLSEEQLLELGQRTQETYRQREEEWLRRIKSLNIWPVLVICGAAHYEPFIEKLTQEGVNVVEGGMFVKAFA